MFFLCKPAKKVVGGISMDRMLKNLDYMKEMVELLQAGKLKEIIDRLDFSTPETKSLSSSWLYIDNPPGFMVRVMQSIVQLSAFGGLNCPCDAYHVSIYFEDECYSESIGKLELEEKTITFYPDMMHNSYLQQRDTFEEELKAARIQLNEMESSFVAKFFKGKSIEKLRRRCEYLDGEVKDYNNRIGWFEKNKGNILAKVNTVAAAVELLGFTVVHK
jgi:hypothetical protein